MSQLESIKSQMMKLKIEKRRIEVCQRKIGSLIFESHENGSLNNMNVEDEVKKIIAKVKVTEDDIDTLWSGF